MFHRSSFICRLGVSDIQRIQYSVPPLIIFDTILKIVMTVQVWKTCIHNVSAIFLGTSIMTVYMIYFLGVVWILCDYVVRRYPFYLTSVLSICSWTLLTSLCGIVILIASRISHKYMWILCFMFFIQICLWIFVVKRHLIRVSIEYLNQWIEQHSNQNTYWSTKKRNALRRTEGVYNTPFQIATVPPNGFCLLYAFEVCTQSSLTSIDQLCRATQQYLRKNNELVIDYMLTGNDESQIKTMNSTTPYEDLYNTFKHIFTSDVTNLGSSFINIFAYSFSVNVLLLTADQRHKNLCTQIFHILDDQMYIILFLHEGHYYPLLTASIPLTHDTMKQLAQHYTGEL